MKFMITVKASKASEAGAMPSEALIASMTTFNQQLGQAGILLDAGGLHPTSRALRIHFANGKSALTEGPFPLSGDIVSGFWIIDVKSRQEAIDWFKRVPSPAEEGQEAEIELRPLFGPEDFAQ